MNENDIKQLIIDTLGVGKRTNTDIAGGHKGKSKMQFSKKLMVFSCSLYACTWGVSVVSWFLESSFPSELKTMATLLFGATFACYEAKACIENKEKLKHFNYQDFDV